MAKTEMIHIDGLSVILDSVRPELQRAYLLVQADVAAKTGPQRNIAKAKLNEVTKQILLDATPHLLLKASPRYAGARGFFEAVNKRIA